MDKRQCGSDDPSGDADRHHSGIRPAYDIRDSVRGRRGSVHGSARKLHLTGRTRLDPSSGRKQEELPLGQDNKLRRRSDVRLRRDAPDVDSPVSSPALSIQIPDISDVHTGVTRRRLWSGLHRYLHR